MELLELDGTTDYKYKDVTFKIRTTMTAGDKWKIDMGGTLLDDGKVQFSPQKYWETLIKTFVISWDGVTKKGKNIEWNYDTFMKFFPPDETGEDLIMKLGIFIDQKLSVIKSEKAEELKNV